MNIYRIARARAVGLGAAGLLASALLTACGGEDVPLDAAAAGPSVVATTPTAAAAVADTSAIGAEFDRGMDPASLTSASFTVTCGGAGRVDGRITYDAAARRVTLVADSPLPADENCTARITSRARDLKGIPLPRDVSWTFATRFDAATVERGRQIFRYDTFGDEAKWTDVLRMQEVISSAVDPVTALSVGLKVDAEALPASVVAGIKDGSISLTSPATTVALLKLNAVVGVRGEVQDVEGKPTLVRVGITCALCHSTVDDSFAPGIGKRLDGWPNRDLDPGAIIALSPALTAEQKAVYRSWGKGKYDPRFNLDGLSSGQVIPPAYGLRGIHRITVTGDGEDVAYWNRYVAVTQMGGKGSFSDVRTGVSVVNGTEDLVGPKLPALQRYQLSLIAPPPPARSFDAAAAARGRAVFQGAGGCAGCHSGPELTDANLRLHAPAEVVSEPEPDGAPSYALRSATKLYRTAPLKGIWQHPPYFHNGSAATLEEVVARYNERKRLGLDAAQMADLVQYLRSL